MVKRILLISILALTLIFVPVWALAQDTVVVIDGEEHIFSHNLVNVEGRTLFPIRPLMEILGTNIHWDSTANTIVFYIDYNQVHIPIEGYIALINGEKSPLDTPTRLINGYTFVPLRFISENLGYDVNWYNETRTIKIIIPGDYYENEASTIKIIIPEAYNECTIIYSKTGIASWYGGRFHGRRTANGEIFNQHAYTAAHRTLPFGTIVNVTSTATGKSVQVRINDRGPFTQGRSIDLSMAAAEAIGLRSRGIGEVRIDVLMPE